MGVADVTAAAVSLHNLLVLVLPTVIRVLKV
jgi:hypothetical protein